MKDVTYVVGLLLGEVREEHDVLHEEHDLRDEPHGRDAEPEQVHKVLVAHLLVPPPLDDPDGDDDYADGRDDLEHELGAEGSRVVVLQVDVKNEAQDEDDDVHDDGEEGEPGEGHEQVVDLRVQRHAATYFGRHCPKHWHFRNFDLFPQ